MRDTQVPMSLPLAGLPWTTWLLLAAATLPGVLLALAFYLTHRARR